MVQMTSRFKWFRWWRWLILLGAPAALGLLELWHPSHVYFDHMLAHAEEGDWWLTLHIYQLPLFALVATSIWLLLKEVDHFFACISRIALWIFAITYTAFDTLAGISTGILIKYMRDAAITVDDPAYDRMYELFLSLFNLDMPGGELLITLAVWSWVAAVLFAAIALYLKGVNRAGVILIGASAFTFQTHVYPNGPITMALLLAGIICIEFFPHIWNEASIKKEEVVTK
ncbi:hypothetical protein [Marinicrinis sediminis]|uniref:DUF4386 domain-containing protein n=1 Tax=Marinicrinis sediminis TaxID=1652465 RepID=A0ABW5RDX2_9BACL